MKKRFQRLINSLSSLPEINSISSDYGQGDSISRLNVSFIPRLPNGREASASVSINIMLRGSELDVKDCFDAVASTLKRIRDSITLSCDVAILSGQIKYPSLSGSTEKDLAVPGTTESPTSTKIQKEDSTRPGAVLRFPSKILRHSKPFDPSAV